MTAITPYLNFDGDCREAMQLYGKCLGAEVRSTPFIDAQGKPSSDPHARLMHCELVRDGRPILQASDLHPGMTLQRGNNVHVSVALGSIKEVDDAFGALSERGKVTYPLGEVRWSPRFGMLTDRFGVQWLLTFMPSR